MANNLGWQDWVAYAEENYLGATDLRITRGSTAILLLHQAIEKYLKAVLVQQSGLPDRSHDLVMLLRLVEPSVVFEDDLWKAARELNYLLPRACYPNAAQKITPEAVQRAFEFAAALRTLALAKLPS